MFGNNLKLAMKSQKISQQELADHLGYTQQAINRWCNNITEPDVKTITKIANYLNISTDFLFKSNVTNNDGDTILQEKQILKRVFIKAGFLTKDEELTDQLLNNTLHFITNNKEFIKRLKN